ncbi:MAG TPA: hypothetical protein VLZ78_04070 [Terrimesophilobacter sp.]|nr:hypothetical protein [Terrimesophilobacter sp.]
MPTIRTITLADSENAPTITATCNDTGWNGFHVPLLTADEYRAHIAALAANDPNGEWDLISIMETDEGVIMHSCLECDPIDGCDHTTDDLWLFEPGTDRAWLDGLVWV